MAGNDFTALDLSQGRHLLSLRTLAANDNFPLAATPGLLELPSPEREIQGVVGARWLVISRARLQDIWAKMGSSPLWVSSHR